MEQTSFSCVTDVGEENRRIHERRGTFVVEAPTPAEDAEARIAREGAAVVQAFLAAKRAKYLADERFNQSTQKIFRFIHRVPIEQRHLLADLPGMDEFVQSQSVTGTFQPFKD